MTAITSSTLADRLVSEYLDGRTFGTQTPSSGTAEFKGHAETAIRSLVETYESNPDLLLSYSDLAIGRHFDRRLRESWGSDMPAGLNLDNESISTAFGAWARAVVKDTTDTTPTSDDPTFIPPFADHISQNEWPSTGPSLVAWAKNDTPDIKAGVDEQITYLCGDATHDQIVVGMDNSGSGRKYGSRAEEKTYLGVLMRAKARRLFQPGTEWVLGGPSINKHGLDGHDGQTVKITSFSRVDEGSLIFRGTIDGHTYEYAVWSDDIVAKYDAPQVETPEVVEPAPTAEEYGAAVERIDYLTRNNASLRRDFEYLATAIKDEAENRSWCSEYDTFIDEVNAHLEIMDIELREREYEVTINYSVRGSGTWTTTVSATSEESAQEAATSEFEYDDIDTSGMDLDDIDVDDVDVNEA